jgi:hypothetical protein
LEIGSLAPKRENLFPVVLHTQTFDNCDSFNESDIAVRNV